VPDLLVGRQRDPPALFAVQADRQVQLKLAASGLVAKSADKASANQMQLRLGQGAL
jgi:hypothetical protein